MARRHKHEEHANHEAWAIPYGDLVTLLLAFFVVMYAMSSVNEGKYRVLSDSLNAAFSGAPRTMSPIQVGEKQVGNGADIHMSIVQQAMLQGQPRSMLSPPVSWRNMPANQAQAAPPEAPVDRREEELNNVAQQVERAMKELIDKNLIAVRRHGQWVEVEIRTDLLFPSGVATLAPQAQAVVAQLGATLKPFPNPIRVEGHTDNRPISTLAFPSNWELSSARASSVVHTFTKVGVDPARLAVIGLGEFRPAQPNDTPQGRTANRRVLLIILGTDGAPPEGSYGDDRGKPEEQIVAPASAMSEVTITDAAPAIEVPMPVAPIASNQPN
jgi:chemotaxis protein MotB